MNSLAAGPTRCSPFTATCAPSLNIIIFPCHFSPNNYGLLIDLSIQIWIPMFPFNCWPLVLCVLKHLTNINMVYMSTLRVALDLRLNLNKRCMPHFDHMNATLEEKNFFLKNFSKTILFKSWLSESNASLCHHVTFFWFVAKFNHCMYNGLIGLFLAWPGFQSHANIDKYEYILLTRKILVCLCLHHYMKLYVEF